MGKSTLEESVMEREGSRSSDRNSRKSGENGPEKEQFRKNPANICGNGRFAVDKALRKVEGEHRRGSSHPHEHWRLPPRKSFPLGSLEDITGGRQRAGCGRWAETHAQSALSIFY
jgi:hypothetical protein